MFIHWPSANQLCYAISIMLYQLVMFRRDNNENVEILLVGIGEKIIGSQ